MPPLLREVRSRPPPLAEIVRRAARCPGSSPRASTAMDEGRADHGAAPSCLAHCEREVTVVAVEKAVGVVEAAHRIEKGPPQEETDAVNRRHLCQFRPEIHAPLEA